MTEVRPFAFAFALALVSAFALAFALYKPMRFEALAPPITAISVGPLGIRETGRIVGDYMLEAEDFLEMRSFPGDIARNA
ncbi:MULTISPECIES: FAD-dependent oxidoreductase [unclassified Cohnella]|uniref:FAD-dependent oxidoreductase n=1 Tax=Cohnella sp. OV330 TaxID=1855288 RepID=UPI000B7CA645